MKWLKDHVMALVSGLVLSAFLAWQLFVSQLSKRRAERMAIKEAENDVKKAVKSAIDVKTIADMETKQDREKAKEKINADGYDLGDLFDELDARASKRGD